MTLNKTEKKASILSNIANSVWLLLTIIVFAIMFYATTSNTLKQHTEQIDEIKSDVGSIKTQMRDAAIEQSVSAETIKNLEEKVSGVDEKVDRMDEKLDRILMQTR